MKHLLNIVFFVVVLNFPYLCGAKDISVSSIAVPPISADSVLKKVQNFAPLYETLIEDYRAELYVKGRVFVRKKNFLFRYAPSMFKYKRGIREYMIETYSDLHYTAPDMYDQKLKATYDTIDRFQGIGVDLLEYFHVNIYSTSLLHSKLISPLSGSAQKHYDFSIDSLRREKDEWLYRVSFKPKYKSYQLVEGHMLVSGKVWSVRELQFSGRSEYLHFDNLIRMGEVGTESEFLPVTFNLNATFRMLGNAVDGNFSAVFDYKSIDLADTPLKRKKREKTNYDLTESFRLRCDTSRYLQLDSLQFAQLRPIPLSVHEQNLYKEYQQAQDSVPSKKARTKSQIFWSEFEEFGDALVNRHTFDMADGGRLRISPILNPFVISYSGKDGFSYRYDIRYSNTFKGDRFLRLSPRVGYNFRHKEFYWRLHGDFDYWPRKRASFHLKTGSGNRIYSSEVLDDLKEIPDSIFDFNKIHLEYFRNVYFELMHKVEIFNGFSIDLGISMHERKAVTKSEFVSPGDGDGNGEDGSGQEIITDPEFHEKFRNKYRSFAPRVKVSWTPGQYYYMNGDRKINLHAKWPTFSIDWERGIKGVLGGTGQYERIEFDAQYQRSLGLMRTIAFRIGAGVFTEQDQMYFVDFENFAKNNLPLGWNDEIGGVFQLLDRRWYNASRKYFRSHLTYEVPFLILPRLKKYTRNILNERLYFGLLMMPHLNPYLEVGYGIGTHIFDFGVFASSINGKFADVGVKFTFELFNR
ncbi:MAG: DUF5686 family protein [Bacteroides sp.]|nr:DUF5686 family protein [Bacteroides sp.]